MYLAFIFNMGNEGKITGLKETQEKEFDKSLYVQVSKEVFEFIQAKIEERCELFVKELPEVLSDTSLIRTVKMDPLVKFKEELTTKAMNIVNSRFLPIDVVPFFEFTCANNALLERGIVITDENRDDKYLEIIQSDDAQLIDILERYLVNKELLGFMSKGFSSYNTFTTQLFIASNEQEAKDAFEELTTKM